MKETIGFIWTRRNGRRHGAQPSEAGYALVVNDIDSTEVTTLVAAGAREGLRSIPLGYMSRTEGWPRTHARLTSGPMLACGSEFRV